MMKNLWEILVTISRVSTSW